MSGPRRIQLSRRKGFRLSEASDNPMGVVIVDRRHPRWGNPFRVGIHGDHAECVALYRRWLTDVSDEAVDWRNSLYDDPNFKAMPWNGILFVWMGALEELRQKDLACWCATDVCHASVLLELANA